jgi:hypothetical protein
LNASTVGKLGQKPKGGRTETRAVLNVHTLTF